MLLKIAAFEFRYQLKNPVSWVAAGIFLLFSFGIASDAVPIRPPGGNTHGNAPYIIAQAQLVLSIFYMFVTTAFVANVIVRDDDTAFGPKIGRAHV